MATFDFQSVQGDNSDLLTDTLTYSDGSAIDLTGATLKFVARSLTAAQPLTLTGTVTSTAPTTGQIQYAPTSADTSTPGLYMTNWVITLPGGAVKTFPTVGYNSWSIEQNLTAPGGQQLVSLPDVKEKLNITSQTKTLDGKLTRWIMAVRPIVESITGPIIVQTFEEWHDGGQYSIQLRRRPSTALGTTPVLSILGCDEYRGPIKYPLAVVADPAAASIYSVMLDPRTATLYRRTTGGGLIAFGAGAWGGGMPQSVHVVYQAGQSTIPWNVYEGTLELLRENYMTEMQVGAGSQTVADAEDQGLPSPGFFVSRRVRELLMPNRRHPGFA